jgi:single-strand DNA-binding protein
MANLNKVLLIGNLTRDPELRNTPQGLAICEFGIAINRQYTTSDGVKKEEVCFVDITVWGSQAQACSRFIKKGSPVFIEGRLKLDSWQDKETGKNRSKLTVVSERVQFLGGTGAPKQQDGEQGSGYQQNQSQPQRQDYSRSQVQKAPAQQQQQAAPPPPPPPEDIFEPESGEPDDDIPF